MTVHPQPGTWTGADSGGVTWKAEVETDRFDMGAPIVVTIDITNEDGHGWDESGLAIMTPAQAREVAAELLRCADLADTQNSREREASDA